MTRILEDLASHFSFREVNVKLTARLPIAVAGKSAGRPAIGEIVWQRQIIGPRQHAARVPAEFVAEGNSTMAAISRSGELRRAKPTCLHANFVEPDEFLRLLLSRRVLVRSDRSEGNIRGLLEPTTGQHFLIEHVRLLHR
jgi:hypothetical protein